MTVFASPERLEDAAVLEEHILLQESFCFPWYDCIPIPILILNQHRQIVFANKALLHFLSLSQQAVLGKRPGEAMGCLHADCLESGCGTSEFCSKCGAVRAILSSHNGSSDTRECRILQKGPDGVEAFDFRVTAEPVTLSGSLFTIFSMSDISHEKRRLQLERTFFHDILDSASGMQALLGSLLGKTQPDHKAVSLLYQEARNLLDMIQSQKELLAAERGQLEVVTSEVDSRRILRATADRFMDSPIRKDVRGIVSPECRSIQFKSDPGLLGRVLTNMYKNALEASEPGQTVTLGCEADPEQIRLWIHNESFMPRDVQLQVFKRSFSTKAADRGIGTYGIKLLTERYLKGSVDFSSEPGSGTTFVVSLPRN